MTAGSAWLLASALWAGCAVPGPWWTVVPALVAIAGAGRFRRPVLALVVAAAGLALLGSGLVGGRGQLAEQGPLVTLAHAGGSASIQAVVVSETRSSRHGSWALLRVREVEGVPTRTRASVRWNDPDRPPALGEQIRLLATGRPLGAEGLDAHLRRLHASVELTPVAPVEHIAPAGPAWRVTTRIRARLRAAAQQRFDPAHAVVLTALVTGDTTDQPEGQRERLAAAGLSHLVVVSGRHVGILLAGVLGLAGLLGVGVRQRRLLALAALAWFVLLVRWQPSVLRAAGMAALVLLAGVLGRRTDTRHAFAMAVIVLLLVDPLLAGHLGFVLSVGATAGVLLGAPVIAERLRGPRPVRLLVGACVGAQLGASPVLLQLGDGVPLWSLPANLVAVPAAAIAQSLGLIAAIAAQVSVSAGAALAGLATPFLALIVWAAETFSSGPRLRPEHLLSPVAAVLALALVLRRRSPAVALAAVALIALVPVAGLVRPAPAVDTLTVTALDVGQGDAILVEAPGRDGPTRVLVDGGPDADSALRLLRSRGIRRLDAVVLSHPHHDHSGGLPAVLRSLQVAALVVGPGPLQPQMASSAHETYAVARGKRIPIVPVSAGQRLRMGGVDALVLSPSDGARLGEDLNENSVVLRLGEEVGGVLLTGDAEVLAQEWMLRRPDLLRARVLKVPHHGGATNAPGFLDAVGAEVALIGVGADNSFGHPTPSVLADLARADVRRTDLHGDVTVTLGADGPAVHSARRPSGRLHAFAAQFRHTAMRPAHRASLERTNP